MQMIRFARIGLGGLLGGALVFLLAAGTGAAPTERHGNPEGEGHPVPADAPAEPTGEAAAATAPVPEEAAEPGRPEPRWASAPGMRVYGATPGGPYNTYETTWQDLAQVVATADGGYLAAGTVAYELRLLKFDQRGGLEWTRWHVAPADLYGQALAAAPDGGYRIAGGHGWGRPGFVIAFDAAGEVLWARSSNAQWSDADHHERLTGVAVSAAGETVAVGWRSDAGEPEALVIAFDADGDLLWRQVLPDGASAHAVVALDDGWFIAGESADPRQAPWLARVGRDGVFVWAFSIDEFGSGAANAAALLPDGQVMVAGHREDSDAFWLMRVTPAGEIVSGRRLEIRDGDYPVVDRLLGLAADADGSFLVSGTTPDADAWIARLDPQQGVNWYQVYGGDGEDSLKAVLPRSDGLVAAGLSSSADPDAGYGLWVVAADREGEPLPGAVLSKPAQELRESLIGLLRNPESQLLMGGHPEILEGPDGRMRVTLPFLSTTLRWPPDTGSEIVELDLGTMIADVTPLGERRWQVAVGLPAVVDVWDDVGGTAGRITLGERSLTGVWAADLATMLKLGLHLGDLALEFDPDPPLAVLAPDAEAGAWQAGEGSGPAQPARLRAKGLSVTLDLDEQRPGVVTGPLDLVLEGVSLEAGDGAPQGRLGRLALGADYQDVDLGALTALAELTADPEGLMERDPGELLTEVLNALGGLGARAALTDLAIEAPPGEQGHLRVAHAAVGTGFSPSGKDALKRDFWSSLEGRGWSFETEEFAFDLDAFDWNLRLDRISPMTLLRLGIESMMAGEFAEAQALASAHETLGGFEFRLSLSGASAWAGQYLGEGPAPGLERFEFGLGVSELDTPAAGVVLTYRHRGLSGLPMDMIQVPEEFLPRELVLDLAASRLPVAFFAAEGRGLDPAEVDPQEALMALLENASRLDINELVIDLPIGGLRLKANARADRGDAMVPGILRSEVELEIRNLDKLIELAMELAGSQEARQQIMVTATMLKLLGEERRNDAGEVVHSFHIQASSLGELRINGNDLAPLIAGGGG
jgi:hypothetical protein